MSWYYVVEVPFAGHEDWFEVARCDSVDGVADVVAVLARHARRPGYQIRVTTVQATMPPASSNDPPSLV